MSPVGQIEDDFDPVCDFCQQPISSTELRYTKIDTAGLIQCKACQLLQPHKPDQVPYARKRI